MGEQQAHRLGPALHRGDVHGRFADRLVGAVRIEAARKHGLERGEVIAFRRPVERRIVLGGDLVPKVRAFGQDRAGARSVAATAGRHELIHSG